MYSLFNDFNVELSEGQCLVVMPLSRVVFTETFTIRPFKFYPPMSIDISVLRPVPNKTIKNALDDSEIAVLERQDLREVKTSITGFCPEILSQNPVIAFTVDIDWDEFLSADYEYDIALIKKLSQQAEFAKDIIRFEFCRFDLPDTLPGPVGTWEGSGQFSGALLYTPLDHESYLIAGAVIVSSIVIKGIGLEIDRIPTVSLPSPPSEVAAIARHGLRLFSDAMSANSDTTKFIRIMTLLEYLANPDSYANWKESKGDLICHIAKNKKEYCDLIERFKEFTSLRDGSGKQRGYRTL